MGLRSPLAGSYSDTGSDRVALRFPDEAAARDVRELGGSQLHVSTVHAAADGEIGSGVLDRGAHLVVDRVVGDTLVATPGAGTLPASGSVLVSWTELNDAASVRGSAGRLGDLVMIDCEWPPERVQRRAFRRAVVELPAWLVPVDRPDEVLVATSRDLSGAGVSLGLSAAGPAEGDRFIAVLHAEERAVVLPAVVHWCRADGKVLGLRFEQIAARDQDHLVALVARRERERS